jgi:Histone H1-like protein Hc1
MDLKDSIHQMNELLNGMLRDLVKTAKGNRAAAQRVRTASVDFAKIAKVFRKESILINGKSRKK